MNALHMIGSSGPVVDNLIEEWRDRFSSIEHTAMGSLDEALAAIVHRRPQRIVYCGRASESSWSTNGSPSIDEVAYIERLVRTAGEFDAHVLVLSSDGIFSGPKLFHEENEPIAEDLECRHQHTVEQAALNAGPKRVLVVRTHAFGWSRCGHSFAEQIWQTLERGEPLEVDAAAFATPILTNDLAELLLRCIRARLHGLLHVGGAERTSQLRFALEMASIAGFDRRLVRSKPADILASDMVRSQRETSLASRLVRRELGVALPLLRESLLRFAEQAASGYRDRLRGTAEESLIRAA